MAELIAVLSGVAVAGLLLLAIPIGRMTVEFVKTALRPSHGNPPAGPHNSDRL